MPSVSEIREARSRNMAAIRSTDTLPELAVRRLAHSLGYRFRLHVRGLPGRPDLVFPSRRKVVFVHGCFWHQHSCRTWSRTTREAPYWKAKFTRNKARDEAAPRVLKDAGWNVLVLWECQLDSAKRIERRLLRFLGPPVALDLKMSRTGANALAPDL